VNERALIFTQYSEMGGMLKNHLEEAYGREIFFLHGGIVQKKRDKMVTYFQEDKNAPPIFILSVKAGGLGLNLTSANHVFHFDRWWNPAVENQATDRSFRIGQKKNVQAYKFITQGTLEEKIDEMIESKKDLSDRILSAGDSWLTELSNDKLRELFSLREEY
jgi:SNF2 family DNA or RNA helicase